MINIETAKEKDSEVLALLGRITYAESHGHFVALKSDLLSYLNEAFSVANMKQEITDPNNLYYIIYVNGLPVGYAKIVLNTQHEKIASVNNCRLDRIYILDDFIPLKIGQQLLSFIEKKAKELQLDTIWLCTYVKNTRAIKFYQKNEYKAVGKLDFMVSGTPYENFIYSKII